MQMKLKLLLIAGFALLSSFLAVLPAQSQTDNGLGTVSEPKWGLHVAKNYKGNVETGLPKFVNALLNFLTGVAAVWLLFVIITSGIKIISSARSPEDFTAQMKKIMWSCIGLVVVALAYVIVTWLLKAFFGDETLIDNPVKKLL